MTKHINIYQNISHWKILLFSLSLYIHKDHRNKSNLKVEFGLFFEKSLTYIPQNDIEEFKGVYIQGVMKQWKRKTIKITKLFFTFHDNMTFATTANGAFARYVMLEWPEVDRIGI